MHSAPRRTPTARLAAAVTLACFATCSSCNASAQDQPQSATRRAAAPEAVERHSRCTFFVSFAPGATALPSSAATLLEQAVQYRREMGYAVPVVVRLTGAYQDVRNLDAARGEAIAAELRRLGLAQADIDMQFEQAGRLSSRSASAALSVCPPYNRVPTIFDPAQDLPPEAKAWTARIAVGGQHFEVPVRYLPGGMWWNDPPLVELHFPSLDLELTWPGLRDMSDPETRRCAAARPRCDDLIVVRTAPEDRFIPGPHAPPSTVGLGVLGEDWERGVTEIPGRLPDQLSQVRFFVDRTGPGTRVYFQAVRFFGFCEMKDRTIPADRLTLTDIERQLRAPMTCQVTNVPLPPGLRVSIYMSSDLFSEVVSVFEHVVSLIQTFRKQ